jgi:hypothetical protein
MAGDPQADEPAFRTLIRQIADAVTRFEADLPFESEHGFVARRPKRARLTAWAVVSDGNGHQVSHIHPRAWLSGVYYVRVPTPPADHPRGGWLLLGDLEPFATCPPPWGIREVQPAAGRLVMFPSYVPHSTVETRSNEPRICVAFDVLPVTARPD